MRGLRSTLIAPSAGGKLSKSSQSSSAQKADITALPTGAEPRARTPIPVGAEDLGGVALGTLITVAAVGYVPPRPAPNLCWYWADPYGSRGYWDYCS